MCRVFATMGDMSWKLAGRYFQDPSSAGFQKLHYGRNLIHKKHGPKFNVFWNGYKKRIYGPLT